MRAEHHTATLVVGRPPRALASVAGALLAVRLLAAAGDFGARAGIVRALASVGLLGDHRLMDDGLVGRDAEHTVVEIDAAQHFAGEIDDVGLHQ